MVTLLPLDRTRRQPPKNQNGRLRAAPAPVGIRLAWTICSGFQIATRPAPQPVKLALKKCLQKGGRNMKNLKGNMALTNDEAVELYSLLCDVIERAWQRWDVDSYKDDMRVHTSEYARVAANRIMEFLSE